MGYLHINNLYKDDRILLFKECYALEKIHGTSAHISFDIFTDKKETSVFDSELNGIYCKVHYFSGGENYMNFLKLFDTKKLADIFLQIGINHKIILYGEAYGGKQQGMSDTYGKELKFIIFDVQIDDNWLSVPQAEGITKQFDLEFVHYNLIPTEIGFLNGERDSDSVQAIRNGVGKGKMREGIVLRPLIELTANNGERIIAKYKRPEFSERKSKSDTNLTQDKKEILEKIEPIVDEWVTDMRLSHILGKLETYSIEDTSKIIILMQADILREAKDEILINEQNKDLLRAIGKKTAELFKKNLNGEIK